MSPTGRPAACSGLEVLERAPGRLVVRMANSNAGGIGWAAALLVTMASLGTLFMALSDDNPARRESYVTLLWVLGVVWAVALAVSFLALWLRSSSA